MNVGEEEEEGEDGERRVEAQILESFDVLPLAIPPLSLCISSLLYSSVPAHRKSNTIHTHTQTNTRTHTYAVTPSNQVKVFQYGNELCHFAALLCLCL